MPGISKININSLFHIQYFLEYGEKTEKIFKTMTRNYCTNFLFQSETQIICWNLCTRSARYMDRNILHLYKIDLFNFSKSYMKSIPHDTLWCAELSNAIIKNKVGCIPSICKFFHLYVSFIMHVKWFEFMNEFHWIIIKMSYTFERWHCIVNDFNAF